MPKNNKTEAMVASYVTPEIRNKFNEICKKEGTNASTVVRQFIMKVVREVNNDN